MPDSKRQDKTREAVSADGLNEELVIRLKQLLDGLLNHKAPPSKFDKLSSPFVVTLIGGVLLALLTTGLQQGFARLEQASTQRKEVAQRRTTMAYDLANEFPMTVTMGYGFKERKIWLDARRYDSKDHFRDGRDFIETRKMCEAYFDRYMAQKPTASLINQVMATFKGTHIHDRGLALNADMDALLGATNDIELKAALSQANLNYKELTLAVFDDLNKPTPHEK
jgi:hypothetical protein